MFVLERRDFFIAQKLAKGLTFNGRSKKFMNIHEIFHKSLIVKIIPSYFEYNLYKFGVKSTRIKTSIKTENFHEFF